MLDGCEMHRDTLRWILQAAMQDGGDGWEVTHLHCYEGWWELFPRVFGICTKEGGCQCSHEHHEGAHEGEEVEGAGADEQETGDVATVTNST